MHLNKLLKKTESEFLTKHFRQNSSKLTYHVLPLILYGIISIWASWPLIKYFNTKIIGGGDALHHLWVLWHTKEWLLGNSPLFFVRELYYPEGMSMLVHSMGPVMGFFALPFWLFGPEAAYNGAAFLGIMLTGYCGYLLARSLKLSLFSSFLVGLMMLLAPIHLAGITGHLWKTFLGILPLTIICVRNSLDVRKSNFWILGTAILVVLSLLYAGYQFVYSIIAITFFIFISILGIKRVKGKKLFVRIFFLIFAIIMFALPLIIGIIRASEEINADVHLQSPYYTPDILQLFLPSIYHPIFGTRTISIIESVSPNSLINLETNITLFYTGIALLIVAATKAWKRSKWWIVYTGISILLVLGPNLKMLGVTEFTSYKLPIIMPYALLTDLPGMDFIRVPGKLMLSAYVGFSVSAGFGIEWINNFISKKFKPAYIVVLPLLLIFEGWTGPWSVSELPQPPRYYEDLASDEDSYGVVDIPLKDPAESSIYMIYQMTHRKGIVNGYLSRYHVYHPFFQDLMGANPPSDVHVNGKTISMDHYENLLSLKNYRYIVKHKYFGGNDRMAIFFEWISKDREPIYDDNLTLVFEINPNIDEIAYVQNVAAFHGKGWYNYDESRGSRWAQSPAEIIIYSQTAQPVKLVADITDIYDQENRESVSNSGPIELVMNEMSTILEFDRNAQAAACLNLQEGLNQIWLSASSGNFIPRETFPNSYDSRILSFSLADVNIITASSQENIGSIDQCQP